MPALGDIAEDRAVQVAADKGRQMHARIYKPAKSAMTSGRGKTRAWVLEFVKENVHRTADPLMGWTSIDDTSGQVRIEFETQEEAVEFAKKEGLTFRVEPARERKRLVKSYSANFDANRKQPWTH
ncbi:MAG: ETC complex I subunit [Hyphomonas sp.]